VPVRGPVEADPTADGAAEDRAYEVMYLLDTVTGESETAAIDALRGRLDTLGDSLVIVGGDGLWNVHVHADDAGAAIEAGMAAGRPHRIRVTYLLGADSAHVHGHAPRTGRGVVSVTAGTGLADLFTSCGATIVARRPGTPPALTTVLEAIMTAGAEVVVLPNEATVIPVAEAAAQRARDQAVRVSVVPTKASVQGLAALAVHDPLRRFDEDVIAMTRAAGATRFGHLAIARREAVTTVGICGPGDVLGLIEGDVVVIGADVGRTGTEILDRMLAGGGELVTLITGVDATPALVERVRAHLRTDWPHVEVVSYAGGHERYPLLFGVE
jgi:dihydroxyacetone kinase-like predicted kinase